MPAPKTIPPELYDDFTLNGQIPVDYTTHFDDEHGPDNPLYWNKEQTDYYLQIARAKNCTTYAEDKFLYQGLDKYRKRIAYKNVAVIGSIRPCYEAILLSYQAHPITIEYSIIICSDSRLKVYTVKEFEQNPRTFDALLSVSSLEHDGLGRYGDPIDPNADLKFMEKAKKLIPKDGLFFLQVPVAKDRLNFNGNRIYGKLRLPMLLKGWKILETYGFSEEMLETEGGTQPLFVLTPEDGFVL